MDHRWDFPAIWKAIFFELILKSSASMYESWGSVFFRTTIRIQWRPDDFEKSRSFIAFFTILGVKEYYAVSSRLVKLLRLVPERKTDKETPECSRLEFLETFRSNNFASSDAEYNVDAEDNSSWLLNRGGVTDFPLLRSLLANCQNLLNSGEW